MSVWPFFRKDVLINETKWFTMMTLLSAVQALLLMGYIIHTLHTAGAILIGSVVMIFRYQWDLNTVFHDISIHYSELVRMDTDVKGMQPMLNDIKKLAHLPQGASTARQWHHFEINDLSFHHLRQPESHHVINQVNFSVKRGEKVALIGESGGGKSTLLNLLSGLYTASLVRLNIDEVSFDSLEPLHAITTLIPQDPEIFENTVAFNPEFAPSFTH
jgi:ABC-type multidrug transport system fused ATPase/permease subunit